MPLKPFKLYGIEGIEYSSVIDKYRQLCLNGIKDIDDSSISVYGISEPKYIIRKHPRKPLRDDTRILNKAKYLIHSISYRQQTSRENNEDGASLQMSVLQDVIGEDVFELMTALVETGHVKKSPIFELGRFSRRYKVIGSIITEPCTNATIRKYIDKTREILNDNISKRLASEEFKKEYGDGFAETYVKNLNRFKISDEKGFNAFAKTQTENNPNSEAYYTFIKNAFKDKLKIYSIDGNNRIYHILTSLKRELKRFINIRYSIDCSNSHPLLFNYFIYLNEDIPVSVSTCISCTLSSIPYNNHYDTKYLRNILIDNGLKKSDIARIEDDELMYLWKTTTGVFWDGLLKVHEEEGYDRVEIKQKMFAEVFYSKTQKDSWKVFAKEFKAQYPNVYALILKWKEPLKHDDTKAVLLRRSKAIELGGRAWMEDETTALPNVMMDLESVIFRDILQALFRKRICAVHIHDAIVIPAVKSTEKIDSTQVQEVMRGAYKRFGLCPTFKVETY